MSGCSVRGCCICCRYNRRSFSCSMFLLRDSDGRPDVFDMLEHENRVFLRIFEFLEKKKWLFIIAQTALNAITCQGLSDLCPAGMTATYRLSHSK